jgi:hypothetical protein
MENPPVHTRQTGFSRATLVAAALISASGGACIGEIGDRPAGVGPPEVGMSAAKFTCTDPAARGAGNGVMRRLSKDELLQSMEALVGAEVLGADAVRQAAAAIPSETTGDVVHEFQNGHAFDHVRGLFFLAEAVAEALAADDARRDDVMGACSAEADGACAEAFVDGVASRVLKRPLDAARRQSMLDAFANEGGGLPAMKRLLARLLQAPEFAFHLEPLRDDGSGQSAPADGPRVAIDPHAVAARVSYALTGAPPDEALLQAADDDELGTVEQVRPHAERLLDTPAARRQLDAILDAWLNLRAIPEPSPAVTANAGFDGTGLSAEARQELLEYVAYQVLERDVEVTTLMTERIGFPRTERVAELYGTDVLEDDGPVALERGHGGLLLRLAPLLSGKRGSSPILRGVYVRKRLLCDVLPSPDFTIVEERTEKLEHADPVLMSTREIVTEITSPETCMTCHTKINPIGFTLESFGPLGQPRTEEIVIDDSGNELARHAIDTTSEDPRIEEGGPARLTGSDDLNAALSGSAKIRACIAERLYTHARLRPAVDADGCALAVVEQALRSGGSVKEAWIGAVVNEDLFWRKAEEGL